ncbi:E3 ubiquitin-protein ligase CCNB1IP1 homolog isoform X2 [Telopea speciosissima]|nr:E3 ubiquitin-protein ligase CCNB1IP1 homolog isoform X2 [Telopea speciosissima]
MRCNACWRELEGRAITTTCGHLLCTEDASKILSNDAACPICDQVLSKSLMKPVEINPNDEWTNMAMAGLSPQILMKSAYRSVMFFIGQKELEMQYKMNKIVAQCRQKCETMQEKFTEKLEQVHTAYQKMAKSCQMMEQQIESLSKDKQELQEKFSEKSRQKRKLDEMYDQLRSEYESLKRSAIQPASNFYPRAEPDLFASPANMMDNRDPLRQVDLFVADRPVFTPETPGPREDVWPQARQKNSNSGNFDVCGSPPAKQPSTYREAGNRRPGGRPLFGAGVGAGSGAGAGTGGSNPSMTLRNLILSPMKRPQLSRSSRPQMFT